MIYLIQKTDYDSSENHDPIYRTLRGYCETAEEATEVVALLDETTPTYDGYEPGASRPVKFPKFGIVAVSRLSIKKVAVEEGAAS